MTNTIPISKLRRAVQDAEPYEMLGVLYDQLAEAKTKTRKSEIQKIITEIEGRIKDAK